MWWSKIVTRSNPPLRKGDQKIGSSICIWTSDASLKSIVFFLSLSLDPMKWGNCQSSCITYTHAQTLPTHPSVLAVGETSKRHGAAVTEGVESVGPCAGPAWAGQMLDSPPFHLTHLEHLQLDCDSERRASFHPLPKKIPANIHALNTLQTSGASGML